MCHISSGKKISNEIISANLINKHQFIQTDLFGNKMQCKVEWIFIGIFSASKLGIDYNEWWKVIINNEILNNLFVD